MTIFVPKAKIRGTRIARSQSKKKFVVAYADLSVHRVYVDNVAKASGDKQSYFVQ